MTAPLLDTATSDQAWGPDAASSPLTYWHWREQRRLSDIGRTVVPIPGVAPALSVVIPAHQPTPSHLRDSVRSVVQQTYPHWELWLCDDGSGDRSVTDAVGELADSERRLNVVALPDRVGASRAINHVLVAAKGEFIVRLDQQDVLEPGALQEIAAVLAAEGDVDVLYSDEDRFTDLERPIQPYFKPDWDPDLLLSTPYLGHVLVIRTELLRAIGGYRPEFDGGQEYDIMLRATERARRVVHIPQILYHRRIDEQTGTVPTAQGDVLDRVEHRVLEAAVARRAIDGRVEPGPFGGAHHLRWAIPGAPTVSVIIPFRDQAALTVDCLDSLGRAPGHAITEIVLVDNGSTEPETRALRLRLEQRDHLRVLDYPEPFNWSAINNIAAATCGTDLLLFMNNDIAATSENWLRSLVELAQRSDVGAVAPRLVYPDGSVQHAGVVLGLGGIAMHLFNGLPRGRIGYFGWDRVVRGYSALTGACLMVRREVFEQVGGFDEALPVAFNDVDFCLRLADAGYRLLYTPHAELTHYESVSRGRSGFTSDFGAFLARWWTRLRSDDPAYNPNLGRFAPWCPLRMPGEDERWLAEVGAAVPEDSAVPSDLSIRDLSGASVTAHPSSESAL